MIQGIGSDLVEIARMAAAYERRGEGLAKRLLSDNEWQRFQSLGAPIEFLAKRFAAKEAVLKAMGTGLRGLSWRDLSIENDALGKPILVTYGYASELVSGCHVHVSITDERDYALAFVIIERIS